MYNAIDIYKEKINLKKEIIDYENKLNELLNE